MDTTTDPIQIIDGALDFFDGGARWQKFGVNNATRLAGCLVGGLSRAAGTFRPSHDAQWHWEQLPNPLRVAVVTALLHTCPDCAYDREVRGWHQDLDHALVYCHNDHHVRDYAALERLLLAARSILVPERELVLAGVR